MILDEQRMAGGTMCVYVLGDLNMDNDAYFEKQTWAHPRSPKRRPKNPPRKQPEDADLPARPHWRDRLDFYINDLFHIHINDGMKTTTSPGEDFKNKFVYDRYVLLQMLRVLSTQYSTVLVRVLYVHKLT